MASKVAFKAQIRDDQESHKQWLLEVWQGSLQEMIAIAQTPISMGGNMPVRTGFLRASAILEKGSTSIPSVDNPDENGSYAYDEGRINLVIASTNLNDTITFGYAASYAAAQEYGANGRQGHRFLGLAVQQWPEIVARQDAAARNRLGLK